MTVDELCLNCMEEGGTAPVCALCGYHQGTPPKSPVYLPPGTVLQNQYVVGRVLGHGGFGVTYLAYDLTLARRVAIKEFLPSDLATRHSGVLGVSVHYEKLRNHFDFGLQRFLEEAQLLAKFQGFPNIIWVTTFFRANETGYMVMEYLPGETFEAFLDRFGNKVPFIVVRSVVMPVIDALREVHRLGVLHRDISPDNIFIVDKGPVKVLDFGAARNAMRQHSQNLSVILKVGYAPEEQYRSKGNQGPWTDVYAVAATMYRALTGTIPPPSIERVRLDELVPPSWAGAELAEPVEAVLLKALAVEAVDRYQTMDEFQAALKQADPAKVQEPQKTDTPLVIVPDTKPLETPDPFQIGKTRPLVVTPESEVLNDPKVVNNESAPDPRPKTPLLLILGPLFAGLMLFSLLAYGLMRMLQPGVPAVDTFKSDAQTINRGQEAHLSWKVGAASTAYIDNGVGNVDPAAGSITVRPAETTQYTLRAENKDGKVATSTLLVIVNQPPPVSAAEIKVFQASAVAVHPSETAVLSWAVQGADEVTITPEIGIKTAQGQLQVRLSQTTEFTLTARGGNGLPVSKTITILVVPQNEAPVRNIPAPTVAFFIASPVEIYAGQSTELRWNVQNATTVSIQPGLGDVPQQGARRVSPVTTTSYALFAVNNQTHQFTRALVTVVVKVGQMQVPQPKPVISFFGAQPQTLYQGRSTTLSWNLLNCQAGEIQPGNIVLKKAAGGFVVTPVENTTYTLTAKGKDGSIVTAEVNVQVISVPQQQVQPPVYRPGYQDPGYQPNYRQPGYGQNAPVPAGAIEVHHHHRETNNQITYCWGYLEIANGTIRYVVQGSNDNRRDPFEISAADVKEIGKNTLLGRLGNQPTIHIHLVNGEKLNFAVKNMSYERALTLLHQAVGR